MIKRHLGEGITPSRAQILEVAAATAPSGRPLGRAPPFNMDDPEGYYQKTIVPRRARSINAPKPNSPSNHARSEK